jgi:formylglycine-generating enzyme required for sulfatase activity
MLRSILSFGLTAASLSLPCHPAWAAPPDAVPVGNVRLDRTEVTIGAFRDFAIKAGLRTAAEREGGGFEYDGGWQRRPVWTYLRPYGDVAGADDEPAVHVSWAEAQAFCETRGGRLPTAAEWRSAAYTEGRNVPSAGFERGRTYRFPTGEHPAGMWIASAGATRHRTVATGPEGVNGLHDMGGNVWEWLADRQGDQALTAGGSWWYDSSQTQAESMQWKNASFYAVYIGFRCAYDR